MIRADDVRMDHIFAEPGSTKRAADLRVEPIGS